MKNHMCFCLVLWLFSLLGETKRKCCGKAQGIFIRDIANVPCYKQISQDFYSDWSRNSASVPYSREDDVLLKNSADVTESKENIDFVENSECMLGFNEDKNQLGSSASLSDKKGENEISNGNSALTSYSMHDKQLGNSAYIQDSKESDKQLENSAGLSCTSDNFLSNLNDCECGAMCSCPMSCACRQKKSILSPLRGQPPPNQINNRSPVRNRLVQTNPASVFVPGNELTMKDKLKSVEDLSVKKGETYYDEDFQANPIAVRGKLNGAENQNDNLEEILKNANIRETKGVDSNTINTYCKLCCKGVRSSDNYDLSKGLECRDDKKSEKSQSFNPLNYGNSDSLQILESSNVPSLKDFNVKNVMTPKTKSKINFFTNTGNIERAELAAVQDHRSDLMVRDSTKTDYIIARGQKNVIKNDVDNTELTNENKSNKKIDSSERMLKDINTQTMSAYSEEHEMNNSFADDYNEEIRSKRDLLDTMETIDPQEDTRQADNY